MRNICVQRIAIVPEMILTSWTSSNMAFVEYHVLRSRHKRREMPRRRPHPSLLLCERIAFLQRFLLHGNTQYNLSSNCPSSARPDSATYIKAQPYDLFRLYLASSLCENVMVPTFRACSWSVAVEHVVDFFCRSRRNELGLFQHRRRGIKWVWTKMIVSGHFYVKQHISEI